MSLTPGTRIGPYEIVAPLGKGGMGEVWRARDTRLGREVALKFLPADFAADPERQARFEREAKLLASLNHPHIAVLYGLENLDGQHALAMELVEGEGLDERIARGPVPVEEALPIAAQIADALEAAHERGIVHRDLKPANVRVRADGAVKVLDFSLAKAWEEPGASSDPARSPTITGHHTRAGVILGTAAYMSPEQARGKPVDKRADIWAFGAVLWEMLAGERLFAGETVSDTMAAVLRQEIDWRALPAAVPAEIRRLLRRCLERDSARRLRDIGDARAELDDAGASRAASDPGPASAEEARRPSGRRVAMAAGLLALAPLAWLAGRAGSPGGGFEQAVFTPKTFRSEAIFSARFLPDGRSVVFSSALEGTVPEIYVLRPEYPEPRPVGLRNVHLLAVSAQGELAVLTNPRYVRHRFFTGTLARVQMGAQAPREVLGGVREADWSPDGSGLAVVREVGGKDRLEYPIGTVLDESPGYLSDPRVSPDGQRVACFEHPIRWDDRGRVVVLDRSGHRTVLSDGYDGEEGLAWSPDGREVLYSASLGGADLIAYAVRLSGRRRIALRSTGELIVHDLSRDGRWLVSRDDRSYGIRGRAPGEANEREYRWLQSDVPRLSADGEKLLFMDDAPPWGPNYAAAIQGMRGSPPVRLGEGIPTDLSPDGSWALAVLPTVPSQLVLYPTGPGEPRRLARGGVELYGESGTWFPDGRRVLVSGSEPGRASRCWVQAVDGGAPRAATPEGARDCHLSPDGRLVLSRSATGGYVLYPVEAGEARPVQWVGAGEDVIAWSADGRGVFTVNGYGVPAQVDHVDLAGGRRERRFELAPPDRAGVISIPQVSLARDGAAYAYAYHQVRSHLFVVEGLN